MHRLGIAETVSRHPNVLRDISDRYQAQKKQIAALATRHLLPGG